MPTQFVIVNDQGRLYEGFSADEARPIWRSTKTQRCVMTDEAMVDTVVRQLHQLGFTKCVKRDANAVLRKWVPADLDASEVPSA